MVFVSRLISCRSLVMARLYPLFADLSGRRVLVVGGGGVAERKVRALADTGARIYVLAPEITPGLRMLANIGTIEWQQKRFAPMALQNAWLAVAASDDAALNCLVAAAAHERRIFANVADDAAHSSFHVPAIVYRAPVQVAISTGGAAPALAVAIRAQLEAVLEDTLGPLAALLARWRQRIKSRVSDLASRRRLYRRLMTGAVAAELQSGRFLRAEHELTRELKDWEEQASPAIGRVALVGAGPGDPGLLTRRGFQLLQQADVILHDRLVNDAILALARRDARVINVGKYPGGRGHVQDAIHALMVEYAAAGCRVVRLKGGDPFVFGRGGEELEYLRARGIPYEVVPGITAALACAAYSGVPLTHRDHAHEMRWISAHNAAAVDALDGASLARPEQTLVVYMGVSQLERLTRKLLTHGRSVATPFALIENGTRPEQRVVTGPLIRLPEIARTRGVRAPTVLIVGEVAALGLRLAWFGTDSDFSRAATACAVA